MALVVDPNGTPWSVRRRWWPFPGDALDLTFGWFEVIVGAFFAVLWPFWLAGKFLGVPWVIVVERDGQQVGRESVRGWRRSATRITELAGQVGRGTRSGHFTL